MLKTLHEELKEAPRSAVAVGPAIRAAGDTTRGSSRDHPAVATFLSRTRLNKDGSEKETWHIEFDLSESGLNYEAGDSLGVFPTNDSALVEAVIEALRAPAEFPIGGRSLRDVLFDAVSLSPAPDMLFQLYSYVTGGERRKKARALATGEDPDGDAETLDVLAAIKKFPGVRPDPEAFIETLDPLQPRLYSIASSPKLNPGRVALAVDTVRYVLAGRRRLDLPRRPDRAGCSVEGVCAEGPWLRTACRSIYPDYHDRTRHGCRAVPLLLAGAQGYFCVRPQLALLRSSTLEL